MDSGGDEQAQSRTEDVGEEKETDLWGPRPARGTKLPVGIKPFDLTEMML